MDQREQRLTRGKRFRRVLDAEHEADEDFWGQEFFREDADDDVYLTESDKESVADTDFSDTVDTPSTPHATRRVSIECGVRQRFGTRSRTYRAATVERTATMRVERRVVFRKKRLLPPGSSRKPSRPTRRVSRPVAAEEKESGTTTPVKLRNSTLLRRSAAEEERRRTEELRRPKRPVKTSTRVAKIDLESFLKDVAEMEFANLASLNELEAFEEESKKRALQKRAKQKGPSLTMRSKKVGDVEQTVLELARIKKLPDWMKMKVAPQPHVAQKCVITGLAAKYRDPLTKLPYATIEAFREIRRRAAGIREDTISRDAVFQRALGECPE